MRSKTTQHVAKCGDESGYFMLNWSIVFKQTALKNESFHEIQTCRTSHFCGFIFNIAATQIKSLLNVFIIIMHCGVVKLMFPVMWTSLRSQFAICRKKNLSVGKKNLWTLKKRKFYITYSRPNSKPTTIVHRIGLRKNELKVGFWALLS